MAELRAFRNYFAEIPLCPNRTHTSKPPLYILDWLGWIKKSVILGPRLKEKGLTYLRWPGKTLETKVTTAIAIAALLIA